MSLLFALINQVMGIEMDLTCTLSQKLAVKAYCSTK